MKKEFDFSSSINMKKEFNFSSSIKSKFFGEIEGNKFNDITKVKETILFFDFPEDIIQDNLDELNAIYINLD